jgi:hypothetical protein
MAPDDSCQTWGFQNSSAVAALSTTGRGVCKGDVLFENDVALVLFQFTELESQNCLPLLRPIL